MTARTIADLIRQGRRDTLAGRDAELGLLRQVTAPGGPIVAYVHGPAGIGKTALISALDACLEDEGIRRLHVAAGAVEPTPTAILTALGRAIDQEARTVAELAKALANVKNLTVVMVDDVDTWRLAVSWLRSDLLPALPASTRLVLAGNVTPPPAWSIQYGQYFIDIKLGALPRADSDAAVTAAGLSAEMAERIWLLSGGHPLGLRMAIHAARTGSLGTARDAGELANAILHAIGDSDLRRAVEACAIVRRANRAIMSAILKAEEPIPLSLLEAVEALPFAKRDAEGIYIAEPVRRAIVDWMSGVEPERYQLWRKTAADWIVSRLRAAGRSGRWRYMADLLHLLEQPALRNAFFPPEDEAPPVEPAALTISTRSLRSSDLVAAPTSAPAWSSGLSVCRIAFRWRGDRRAKCWPFIYSHARTIRIPGSAQSTHYSPRGRLIWPRIPSKGKSCSSAKCRQGPMNPIRLAVPLASLI